MTSWRNSVIEKPAPLPSVLLVFLITFVVYPSCMVLTKSFFVDGAPGFDNFVSFATQPHLFQVLWQSVLVALLVAFSSIAMGLCLSLTVFKTELPLRPFFRVAAVIPLVIPGFVTSLAYLFLFGRNGLITYKILHLKLAIYSWKSVAIVQTMNFTTTAFLILSAALLSIDGREEDAARTLGASEWDVFRTVTLPLLRPGLAASAVLIFMCSMADFSTPLFLGGRFGTLASTSYTQLIGSYDLEMASTMNAMLLFICLVAFWIFRMFQRNSDQVRRSSGGSHKAIDFPALPSACIWSASALFSISVWFLLLSVFVAAFTKHLGANFDFTMSYFVAAFQRGWRGMVNTVIFASSSAFASAMIGMVIAWLIARRTFFGRRVLDFLSTVPFAIPGTFFGVGYILAFNGPPLLLSGTWVLVLVLTVVRELPLGVRAGVGMLGQMDGAVEDAAVSLGDSPSGVFFRVVLPIARPAMIVTALHSFVATVQTVGALIFIVSPGTKLLSIDVFEAVFKGDIGIAAALSVVMICLSAAGMSAIVLLSGKREGNRWMFRENVSR